MTPEEEGHRDRQRFLWFIGYFTNQPRWRSNLEAIALVLFAAAFLVRFHLFGF